MERKVGEVFECDGVTLEVVKAKDNDCTACYFNDERDACSFKRVRNIIGFCTPFRRKDMKYVNFKEVY